MRGPLPAAVVLLLTGCPAPDPIGDAWIGVWQVTSFEESVDDDCDQLAPAEPPGAYVSTNVSQGLGAAADLMSVFPCQTNVDCEGAPWVTGVLDELTPTTASGSDATFAYFSNGTTIAAGGDCTLQLQSLTATVDGDLLVVDARGAIEQAVVVDSERECAETLAELEDSGACDARARLEATRLR